MRSLPPFNRLCCSSFSKSKESSQTSENSVVFLLTSFTWRNCWKFAPLVRHSEPFSVVRAGSHSRRPHITDQSEQAHTLKLCVWTQWITEFREYFARGLARMRCIIQLNVTFNSETTQLRDLYDGVPTAAVNKECQIVLIECDEVASTPRWSGKVVRQIHSYGIKRECTRTKYEKCFKNKKLLVIPLFGRRCIEKL